jgi:putative peptidoglycan lipid II flippase
LTEDVDRSASVGRTSLAASAGTLCAKIIGFGRNIALAAAIGTGLVADSYNIANQVPNQIFLLLGGGSIAYVFVPHLIRHARTSAERGDEYGSFLLVVGAVFGVVVTTLLLALSPLVIQLMGGSSWGHAQSSLGLRLSLWCMPQIFFYVMFEVASQLMHARGRFNAVAWMPVVSSLVIVLACIPIIVVGTVQADSPDSMSTREVALLGGSTLLGSILQTILLVMFLRRAGFRLRLRFQIHGLGLHATAIGGLLTVAATVCFQLANLTTAAFSTQAGSAAKSLGYDGRGYTAIFYAQTLLYVAQAVAGVSLANVLLQRLSRHYADGNDRVAHHELNEAILAIGALLIPMMSIFICLGPLGTELMFTRGETDSAAAQFIGVILAVLALGLVPYALHTLLIRPFYAVHDAKTPLRSAAIVGTVWILGSFCSSVLLPPEWVLLGIAGAFGFAYIVDLPLKLRSLNTRLGFNLSGVVMRGYRNALGAGILAAIIIGVSMIYLEHTIPHHWLPRTILLLGGAAGFFTIYYPLTARSPASLRRLVQWLRT